MLAVREKRADVKIASKSYRKNPTNTNVLKLKKGTKWITKHISEYVQNQIDKIRDSVEDRQSRVPWQTINEVSRRKSSAKTKLKVTNQQEKIKSTTKQTHRKLHMNQSPELLVSNWTLN